MWKPDDLTLSVMTIIFGSPFFEPPSTLELLIILAIIFGSPFFGGVFAGIATLIIIRKTNFFIKIFRLLIGAIGGYEGLIIGYIFLGRHSFKNPNEILKSIIDFHYAILKEITHFPKIDLSFLIPGMLGAIGASIALFMSRKIFRWRS
ncbi:hypothetical protein [Nostoc sp. ChiSLP03a]|uniref:hypothetical protein n=1 Tax=Nostoc sp. ChiSLP03a TaxID=3075380 RepID=UPI002AD5A36F|nr:hypothetical protein [Nostoc sp. ChiSLP03a]MDZ8212241.1 hypothetical protein [Nostoc sp. ChiSLP03a]